MLFGGNKARFGNLSQVGSQGILGGIRKIGKLENMRNIWKIRELGDRRKRIKKSEKSKKWNLKGKEEIWKPMDIGKVGIMENRDNRTCMTNISDTYGNYGKLGNREI